MSQKRLRLNELVQIYVGHRLEDANTISLGSHQNIGLHTCARANVVLLTYLLTNLSLSYIFCEHREPSQLHREHTPELKSKFIKRQN